MEILERNAEAMKTPNDDLCSEAVPLLDKHSWVDCIDGETVNLFQRYVLSITHVVNLSCIDHYYAFRLVFAAANETHNAKLSFSRVLNAYTSGVGFV